jgi:hypothetical protein
MTYNSISGGEENIIVLDESPHKNALMDARKAIPNLQAYN